MKASEINTNLRRMKPLLASRDPSHTAQGMALIEALGESALIDKVLETVYTRSVRKRGSGVPDTELSSHTYSGLSRSQILHLIRLSTGSRAAVLRGLITVLAVTGKTLSEATGLTALETLTITGSHPDDIATRLAALPALRTLRLHYGQIPSFAFLPTTLTALSLHACEHPTLDLPDGLQLDTLKLNTDAAPPLTGSLGGCRSLLLLLGRTTHPIGPMSGGDRLEVFSTSGGGAPLALGGLEPILTAAPLKNLQISGRLSEGLCALLPKLHSLERLDARASQLTSLRQLSPRAPLQTMDLRQARLTTLDGLGSRPTLRLIRLDQAIHLVDTSALVGAPNLRLATLCRSPLTPEQLPASVRWACTWQANPDIEVLSTRPLPPDRLETSVAAEAVHLVD